MPHIHKLIDFVATAYIVYQDSNLLIHHKKLNKWLPIGGHIELDEDPNQALIREIQEETGLSPNQFTIIADKPTDKFNTEKIRLLIPPTFMDIHPISGTHSHIGLNYIIKAHTDKVTHNTKEHHQIKWLSAADLTNPKYNLHPATIYYCNSAKKRVALH